MSVTIDEEILKEIEEQAGLALSVDQCALLFGISIEEFFRVGEVKTAYDRGSLRAMCEVRKSVFKMAKQGSTPAQKQMCDFFEMTAKANTRVGNSINLGDS